MDRIRAVNDLEIDGLRVFLRADLNVPWSDGEVTDTTRIDAIVPTIALLRERGCRIIIGSHFGRPKGKPDPEYSLEKIVDTVSERLGLPVQWSPDSIGDEPEAISRSLTPGQILLIENLRFHPGEEANDPEFARALSGLADAYVNDAFGASHRKHASIVALPAIYGPALSAGGLLLAREIEFLHRVNEVDEHERPFIAVLGGAKIKGKIEPLQALVKSADALLIGGGMANTFLAARGVAMSDSLVDEEMIDLAQELLEQNAGKIFLPTDLVVADSVDEPGTVSTVEASSGVPEGMMALDIGPETIKSYSDKLHHAGMVFWNGPMGVFEKEEFSAGTMAMADAVAHSQGVSIVGGGESVDAVGKAGVAEEISHVSTGGGAALELISGESLPGIQALLEVDSAKGD